VTDLTGAGKFLFLGIYWGNFVIFDISNPTAPLYIADGKSLPLDDEGWGAGWSQGVLSGEYLVLPTLSHLRIIDVPYESQALMGAVNVAANLGDPTVVNLVQLVVRSGDSETGSAAAILILILIGILTRRFRPLRRPGCL
jgi:hypothetical protein